MVVRLLLVDKVKMLLNSYWTIVGIFLLILSLNLFLVLSIEKDARMFFGILTALASVMLLKQGYKRLANLEYILADFTLTSAELWENEETEFSIGDDNSQRNYHQLSYLFVVREAPHYDHFTTTNPDSYKQFEPLIYSNINPFECTLLFKLPPSIARMIEKTAKT